MLDRFIKSSKTIIKWSRVKENKQNDHNYTWSPWVIVTIMGIE